MSKIKKNATTVVDIINAFAKYKTELLNNESKLKDVYSLFQSSVFDSFFFQNNFIVTKTNKYRIFDAKQFTIVQGSS